MISRFLVNPAIALMAVLGVVSVVLCVLYTMRGNQITNLLRDLEAHQFKVAMAKSNVKTLESALTTQSQKIITMEQDRKRMIAAYLETLEDLSASRARHDQDLEQLLDETGTTCQDGIRLIDRELGI